MTWAVERVLYTKRPGYAKRVVVRCSCGRVARRWMKGTKLRARGCRQCAAEAATKHRVGARFGRWTIVGEAGRSGNSRMVLCRCDCGELGVVPVHNLTVGASSKCRGCGYAMMPPKPKRETPTTETREVLAAIAAHLDAVGEAPSLADIAKRVGHPRQSCHEKVRHLARFGFVEMESLGHRYTRIKDVTSAGREYLRGDA